MESRAKLFGHPLHQMLVPVPFGLLTAAIVLDIVRFATGNPYWSEIAYWAIAGGVVSGLLAAPFGFLDWLAIPAGTRAKRVGAAHGAGNVFVIVLYAMSWAQRGVDPREPAGIAFLFSFAGGLLAMLTGWMGGELVDRLGVGVDDGANVDAPSSLHRSRVRG